MTRLSSGSRSPVTLGRADARRIWLRAQRLDTREPFGSGPAATRAAVEHLGYVQIDTIHVIERCHHHILWSRIPGYRRADLRRAQSADKTVFEYWTHALSYVPVRDFRFSVPAMLRQRREPIPPWFRGVTDADVRRVVRLILREGPLTIRDFKDEDLVEKDHPWASRKPSKSALQLAFHRGRLVISGNIGSDRMTLKVESDGQPAGLADRLAASMRDVTKLRADIELLAPGSLPNDGKVIEDLRSYE